MSKQKNLIEASQNVTFGTDGNVGIGTSLPATNLVVKGEGSNGTVRIIPDTASAEASIGYYQDTAGTDMEARWVAGVGGWGQTNQFTIGNNNAPKLKIDTSGRVTTPYQTAFHVHGYGQVKPVGWQRVEFGAVALNRGGAYSTHRFTAPIAGMYTFNVGGYIPADGAANRYAFAFYHNGVGATYISGGVQASPDSPLATHSQLIDMNASDYVEVFMYTPASETLGAQYHPMWFQGYLIG